MFNPSKNEEKTKNPIERANDVNETDYQVDKGYYNYDLTHADYGTHLFGQVYPSMVLDTTPGDRFVISNNSKTILNKINGNFLSTINQMEDTFFVSLRNLFPENYEKMIVNPNKGNDIPASALPMVPLMALFYNYLFDYQTIGTGDGEETYDITSMDGMVYDYFTSADQTMLIQLSILLGKLHFLSTILSRGQLLDYLGMSLDLEGFSKDVESVLQTRIDNFQNLLYTLIPVLSYNINRDAEDVVLRSYEVEIDNDTWDISNNVKVYTVPTKEDYRQALSDIYERGHFPLFTISEEEVGEEYLTIFRKVSDAAQDLIDAVRDLTRGFLVEGLSSNTISTHLNNINTSTEPFNAGCFNITKVLAYQQIIAHYFSNDNIDNIFTSDLFMQNLRSIMYPTPEDSIYTQEPTFLYNGVPTEFDLISYGGFVTSLLTEGVAGKGARQHVWMTVMLLLRRSLRYGDYFASSRVNMLAIDDGRLGINVEDGQVSPIDVTRNLLLQRYLNSCNYIGSGFLSYLTSMYGVKPSDLGSIPRFVSHRKSELETNVTTNTADKQGEQTTNLLSTAQNSGIDMYIDDFGVILTLTSYDTLPVYNSGIDSTWYFSDRFDYFNPMLENIGDQSIRLSEIVGFPNYRNSNFGWTMRNSEYKFKLNKSHGGFVNDLPGFLLTYPTSAYVTRDEQGMTVYTINSDFIRDKSVYLDRSIPVLDGVSPAQYYHFVVAHVNEVHAARKIQTTPPVLF